MKSATAIGCILTVTSRATLTRTNQQMSESSMTKIIAKTLFRCAIRS